MSLTPYESFREQVPGLIYGGDYNPEQWPASVWREDVRLMKEAGVSLVSVGVFSWSLLEFADGQFDFDWLDEVMDLLASSSIAVNLATPNASPPPWLATDFPETLMVEQNGTRVAVGSRGHFCPSSTIYRDRSQRLAQKLAERYGGHPALAMWHIGNEYHAHCHCEICDGRFRDWLRKKYQTLDELNARWGTSLWGQNYSDWKQVHLPLPVRGWVNPARELDFARFNTDVQVELYTAERDILRAATPSIPCTTNFVQFFRIQDYRRWAPETDVIALDIYPNPQNEDSLVEAAMQYDLMRHLGGGAPWMMMEQATGAVSQWKTNLPKPPGRMRLGSYQAIAHGADAVMFFQWRASRFGQEKFHSAMLPHGGTATRTWKEVVALGREFAGLAQLAGARSEAKVAIVWDWENWWAVEGAAHPANNYNYRDVVAAHYKALWNTNVAVDVVTLSSDLSSYRALVIPNQYMMSDDQRIAVEAFVEHGGHILVSYFSGIVDQDDQVIPDGYPGGLRRVIGAQILDLSPMSKDTTVLVSVNPGQSLLPSDFTTSANFWQDELVLEGAEAIAVYSEGPLRGRPAIVDHTLGDGSAIYLGTRLPQQALDQVVASFLGRAGVEAPHASPLGVEVTERYKSNDRYLFFLNHTNESLLLELEISGTNLLDNQFVRKGDVLELLGSGIAIIQTNR